MCALTFQKLVDSRKVHVHLIFLFLFLNCQADSKNAIKNSFISLDPVERFQAKFGNWFSPLKNLALHLFQGLRWYYRYYYFFSKWTPVENLASRKSTNFPSLNIFPTLRTCFYFDNRQKKEAASALLDYSDMMMYV